VARFMLSIRSPRVSGTVPEIEIHDSHQLPTGAVSHLYPSGQRTTVAKMPSLSSSSGRYPTHTSALVIGGGPAGLVSLKYLSCEAAAEWPSGEEPVLVEQESELGGTFRWRGYENAELVSSKQLTCFSDFRQVHHGAILHIDVWMAD
jgi:hypothetical protein